MLVIQVVETIFPAFGFGDAAIRVVVIVFGIGLLPVLILAWAFEITPEGLKLEKDVDRSQSITPHTGKKLDRMIMIALALALGYFAFDKFVLSPQRQADELATATEEAHMEGRTEALVESYGDQSIAVLPFVDMSQEGDQEYFSDGIAEELLNLLAKISNDALQTLIDDYADEWSLNIATVLAFRGDTDEAFEWIDKAIEQGHPDLAEIIVNNLYANLYDDPRWPVLPEKLGKSPEQLAAIEFKVRIPD